ncbi:unnamed protein product [Rhizoctonia solani]|uniref:Uncharacterized protein n=1 Tax=Rhizoctonia solani AG-3 Rhs1AP TaxID=1086054 RepID=X8JEL9_9AGAM|nr:hypothetical protein RSOL_413300 [Rhizoctonia solani AG-3 Rhs1AP]CAE6432165.1 unnamed protein product [Rhizoctonia solani]
MSQSNTNTGVISLTTWTRHVRWDGEFRQLDDDTYGHLSHVRKLRELVQKPLIVPAWLANIESPQYEPYRKRMECYRKYIGGLSKAAAVSKYAKNADDSGLSSEVEECLPLILHIRHHAASLQLHSLHLEPMEDDRRHPVDTLGSLVWDFQSDARVIYRAERTLQVPRPSAKHPSYTKPDACAFIPIPDGPAALALMDLVPALSCFPRTGSVSAECGFVVHWVTEFKRHHSEAASKRQVVKGLVSGLYQRRALGFPNHLVFGTAHHSRTVLEVLAATWVPSNEHINSEAPLAQEANTSSIQPPVGQANDPLVNSSQGGDAVGDDYETGETAMDAHTTLTIQDIKKYNKIVVYTIATFSMSHAESVLDLYLLMRLTRILAQQYKEEIENSDGTLISQLSEEAEDIYKWAPPPLQPSRKRQKSDAWSSQLSSTVEEEQDDIMSVDQDEDFDSRPDSEELDSLSDAEPGPTRTITGEVGTYTFQNYAYKGDVRDSHGDP